jgi:hypothetical protein
MLEALDVTPPEPNIMASTTLRAGDQVFAREFDGELVLLDLGRGEYFGLNASGALLWRGAAEGKSVADVAEEASRLYNVSVEESLSDMLELARELCSLGLLVPI